MPQLSELIKKRKFVKKEYRPWDLSGTGTVDGKEKATETIQSKAADIVEQAISQEEKFTIDEPSLPNNMETAPNKIKGNERDNTSGNNQVTTNKQTDNVKITKAKLQDNVEITTREHTNNKKDNITGNTESLPYLIDSIKKLSGIQKNIFLYVMNVCSARGILDTGNILSADLANTANCSIGSAKTSLTRLVEKRLVIRLQGKASRGGHMVLGITKEMQAAAIQAQQALFNPLKASQTDNITGNISNNIQPYSSSIYKNNTTTKIPEEWQKINFDLLQSIGFSETQLCQLYSSNATSPEIVQDSINRFAYSLEYNDKVKAYKDPLNVFMGVLRKGQRWIEPNYISPKELALREILEEKRKQKAQFDIMVKELVELEFPEWRKKLTENEVKQIVPTDVMKTNISAAIQATLRNYFVEKVLAPRFDDVI